MGSGAAVLGFLVFARTLSVPAAAPAEGPGFFAGGLGVPEPVLPFEDGRRPEGQPTAYPRERPRGRNPEVLIPVARNIADPDRPLPGAFPERPTLPDSLQAFLLATPQNRRAAPA